MPQQKIYLFASEIAALIGSNRFLTPEEAFEKVFVRHHLSEKSLRERIIDKKVDEICQTVVFVDKEESKKGFIEQTNIEEKRLEDFLQKKKAKKNNQQSKIEETFEMRDNICKTEEEEEEEKEEKEKEEEEENLSSSDEEILEQEVLQEVRAEITKRHGILSEKEENLEGSQRSFSKKLFSIGQFDFVLVGKVDGYSKKQITELKTRKFRLAYRYWPNEFVQIQMYLFLSNCPTALFIEKCREKKYCQIVQRDETKINNMLSLLQNSCQSHFNQKDLV